MANGKLSRAQVGLALASALVVLLASGVAISRIAKPDDGSPVATGPSSTSSSLPGLGLPGSAGGSGPASAAGVGGVAEQAAQAAGEAASEAPEVTGGVTPRTGAGARKATGNASGASAPATSSPATGGSAGSSSASPEDSSASGGESAGNGQGSPPAPSQQPPEALAAASVSAGEGAQGAVVGVGLNGGPDLDLTVGTNRVVGDHPPSDGTGATFGGRLLHPPSSLPLLPG